MTNYTWNVTNLFTETIDGKEDYVVTALYETIGVDGEYTASLSGSSQFSTEDVTDFIPCRPYRRDCNRLDKGNFRRKWYHLY